MASATLDYRSDHSINNNNKFFFEKKVPYFGLWNTNNLSPFKIIQSTFKTHSKISRSGDAERYCWPTKKIALLNRNKSKPNSYFSSTCQNVTIFPWKNYYKMEKKISICIDEKKDPWSIQDKPTSQISIFLIIMVKVERDHKQWVMGEPVSSLL